MSFLKEKVEFNSKMCTTSLSFSLFISLSLSSSFFSLSSFPFSPLPPFIYLSLLLYPFPSLPCLSFFSLPIFTISLSLITIFLQHRSPTFPFLHMIIFSLFFFFSILLALFPPSSLCNYLSISFLLLFSSFPLYLLSPYHPLPAILLPVYHSQIFFLISCFSFFFPYSSPSRLFTHSIFISTTFSPFLSPSLPSHLYSLSLSLLPFIFSLLPFSLSLLSHYFFISFLLSSTFTLSLFISFAFSHILACNRKQNVNNKTSCVYYYYYY